MAEKSLSWGDQNDQSAEDNQRNKKFNEDWFFIAFLLFDRHSAGWARDAGLRKFKVAFSALLSVIGFGHLLT
ncbi:hypothetical protein [Amphritea balenae]|uniref:Uncharacterized protein n=1 Tax=Amphritea balenae TaxID=452629 RepID=A0A3P1SVN3_9GAMM|nr:hypothetical protein [Amphritea balenae]RRD01015.1 hypothetical protein EHS89_00135 [Amphritea balenae]GGK60689.1 hypothetical protein GCM10007941_08690 [Amphritea balenae]